MTEHACKTCGKPAVNEDSEGNFFCDDHLAKSKTGLFEKMSVDSFLNIPGWMFD